MSKKKNKSLYKSRIRPFVSDNRVLLAVLGGATLGIVLAAAFGSEKAKKVVLSVGESVKDLSAKIKNGRVPLSETVTQGLG